MNRAFDDLRAKWTGRRVRATSAAAPRWAGRMGRVLTINMNGAALVEFEGRADIGWYDLPVEVLEILESQREDHAAASPVAELPTPPAAAIPSPSLPEGPVPWAASQIEENPNLTSKKPSILELARRQGAAKQN